MIILVVGNGFDLAHGLPTKYKHFLNFVNIYRGNEYQDIKDEEEVKIYKQQKMFVEKLKAGKDKIAIEFKTLIEEKNALLYYFLDVYTSRCQNGKEGWIDFESELAEIVKLFDASYQYILKKEEKGEDNTLSNLLSWRLEPFICYGTDLPRGALYSSSSNDLYELANKYLQDLNKISRLLELYLKVFVESIETNIRIPEIYDRCRKADAVLSFNYTDTYRRLYRGTEMIECCFIHGKAKEECNLINNSNLVLGINEYLDTNRSNNDNVFIWFKKFYQRIYKETDSQYIDWINDDIEDNKKKNEKIPFYIYFYGHSLDITDKDILQKLILYDNAKIRIFYHEKKEMGKQIANLTKIIGEENLIHMTRGRDRKIEFIPASKAINEALCKISTKKIVH